MEDRLDELCLTTLQDYTILKQGVALAGDAFGLTTLQDYTILKPNAVQEKLDAVFDYPSGLHHTQTQL